MISHRQKCAALLLLALAGCSGKPWPSMSSAPDGHYQTVRVDTPGVDGAACALQTTAGSYLILSPAMVKIVRTSQPMQVSCTKGEHFKGGATVDARRIDDVYSYPSNISVPMGMNGDSLKADVKVF